jgi:hypothetical protein
MAKNIPPPRPEPSSWSDTARVTFLIMATVAILVVFGLLA